MSLRIIESFRLTQRVAIATAFAASLGLTTLAAADQQVTALLRNGERVTGLFDGYNNNQVYVDVSASDERKIPVGDVALLDFVGGAQGLPETELSQARGDEHVLLLKSGSCDQGSARVRRRHGPQSDAAVPHDAPERNGASASRRSAASTWAATRAPRQSRRRRPPTTTVTTTGQTGGVTVNANQRWTPTGITVAKGQQVRFDASGEVQLSTGRQRHRGDRRLEDGRRLSAGPLPGQLAGALIGRVGNGQAFGIGNQGGPLSMPAAGVLYLGVNDDNVDDNRGAFTVTVTALPTTVTSTGQRPARIRRARSGSV